MAKLVVICDEIGRRQFTLEGDALIGRSPQCAVAIRGPLVSRQHAKITLANGNYFIEDLGSSNGTTLNGNRVEKTQLRDRDRIMLGDCELTFLLDDTETLAEPDLLLDNTDATVYSTVDIGITPTADSGPADSTMATKLKTHLKTLQEVAQTSCGTLVTRTLVERILRQLLRVYPQADHAHAVLLGFAEPYGDLRLSAAPRGEKPPDVGMSRTLLDIATRERKAVLAGDVDSVKRLKRAQSIMAQRLRSMMCCPLVTGPRTLGAIQVDTASVGRPFTTDDLKLLVAIARQVAVAAENARLHREVVTQQRLAAVGQAVSSLAHCMKNVFNNVQGGSYILDLGLKKQDSEKISKGWDMVKRNNDFLAELVRDMLTYCRKGAPERERTDVGELLNYTVLMVQESASQKGVEASLALNGELPQIDIDQTGMKRAVLNLLGNAVEACSKGDHVKVTAGMDEAGKQLRITVEDDGPGIPPEVSKHLFEPFFTTKGSRGTGLGLALVQKVVEEHKGRVEVESEPGRGTTFHISIPVTRGEPDTSVKV